MAWTPLQPPLITLTTDFGLADTYVGVMKGVILGIAPQARLVDLTHAIAPQNLREAGARLEAAIDYFPSGTIHLVVVDPGVGSTRAACVVETARALYVAPDNGVLTLPLRRQPARRFVRLGLSAQQYLRPAISATFHGRDVFAPIAAHLANGLSLDALGDPVAAGEPGVQPLIDLDMPEPQEEYAPDGRARLRLHLLYADRFGNLITDLTPARWSEWLRHRTVRNRTVRNRSLEKRSLRKPSGAGGGRADSGTPSGSAAEEPLSENVQVVVGDRHWSGIVRTFADVPEGQPLAYWGSTGALEIGIRNGNAMQELSLAPGDSVWLVRGIS